MYYLTSGRVGCPRIRTMYSRDKTESPGSSMLVSNSICNVTVRLVVVPRARRLTDADGFAVTPFMSSSSPPPPSQSLTIWERRRRAGGGEAGRALDSRRPNRIGNGRTVVRAPYDMRPSRRELSAKKFKFKWLE